MGVKKMAAAVKDQMVKDAPRAVLEDLFDDFYKRRKQVYWMNFIRGIFFGFGGVIGGTIMVALLLWFLSTLQYVPFLDGFIHATKQSIEDRSK